MYVTEAMIISMEDMQRNANDMEKHMKGMMETEARSHGLELDSRHNARDMWNQLNDHMASMAPAAPVAPAPVVEEHTHEDGTTHAHEGGSEEHTHDPAPAAMPNDEHGNPIAEGTPYRLDSEGLPIDAEGGRIAGIAPAPAES